MTLTWKDIVAELSAAGVLVQVRGATGQAIASIVTDAGKVAPGSLYVAYRGVSFDGHTRIAEAAKRGASAIVCTDPSFQDDARETPILQVTDARAAWTHLSSVLHGHPEAKLTMVGVTGTNGKTSTTWMFRELMSALNEKVVLIGTMGAWIGDEFVPTTHTTPDPPELFGILARAVKAGVRCGVMEVSSHALIQEKLGPIRFKGAAFTSFSRDHLDFHKDMDDYFAAKARLFTSYLTADAVSFVASDVGAKGASLCAPRMPRSYGEVSETLPFSDDATTFTVTDESFEGTTITLARPGGVVQGTVPFFALHAVKNFVAALLLVESVTGKDVPPVQWAKVRAVPGRLEPVFEKRRYVFVDYAHTPDALAKTLAVLRPLAKGKLWVVFGCGGDRDPGKRPMMAAVAEQAADLVVVTSDNPRTENPDAILDAVMKGFKNPAVVTRITDRADAIRHAVHKSSPQDVILIAGKGHEDYQIIGKDKRSFDDRKVAREALEDLL